MLVKLHEMIINKEISAKELFGFYNEYSCMNTHSIDYFTKIFIDNDPMNIITKDFLDYIQQNSAT